MRLVTKSTLSALVAFLILLGLFALWSEYQLRSLTSALMQGTARLLGSEIAAVISQTAAEDLLHADPEAGARLEALVADLSANSEVVAAVTVVDANGLVVASKDVETGRQLTRPDVIFGDKKRSRFLTSPAPLEGGTYHLFVPLLKEDTLLGYLRLSISSDSLMGLYRRARRQLALLALVGLACVVALGLALEVQFSRMGRTLTQAFDAAMRGVEVPERASRREFSEALDVARRAGAELNVARTQTADAQRKFGELMKVMDVGVVLVGADYSLDFANEPARELLHCVDGGELERHWEKIRSRIQASSSAITADGGAVDLDLGADGQGANLRLELYPRDDRDGWLILVKNREMLDALENELRLAIQMRGFAQFYMAFAHDLKAPLNAMVLNLELLKRSLADPNKTAGDEKSKSRQEAYIQTLVGEVSRLDRSLRTVLTHAAPPRDGGRKQFDLRELIEELGSLLDPQARHHRINFKIEVPPTPLPIDGHRDRLKQALLNIAINGLESMPSGGEMSVQAAADGGDAAIEIRDSGPGMPPEVSREIYKMHFTTKDGGTGIGLHVARSVVQAHGGDIHVESEVGRGTCFRVTLPLAAPATAESGVAAEKFLQDV